MLDIKNIDLFYGPFQVVHDVSMRVAEGETIVMFGPNGHGKSSILRAISGLLVPRCGEITFNGTRITGMAPNKIVEMGVVHVLQGTCLFYDMTVVENLMMGAYVSSAWKNREYRRKELFDLFPLLGKIANQKCSTLSGGERAIVAVARGLMSTPKLLILDEPFTGLAPKLVLKLQEDFMRIKKMGMTIILVIEQELSFAAEIADRMYLVEQGRVALEGIGKEILDDSHVREAYMGF